MLLALETALDRCSVALYTGQEADQPHLLAYRQHDQPREQTRQILPMIEAVLQETGQPLQALQAIAFSRGPGSFSGIRINAAVTQALAWTHGLPVIPVSTLLALAQAACQAVPNQSGQGLTEQDQVEPGQANQLTHEQAAHARTRVLAVINAHMDELYTAAAEIDTQGQLSLVTAEALIPRYQSALPAGWLPQQTILAGDGAGLSGLAEQAGLLVCPEVRPDARHIGQLGWWAWRRGETVSAMQAQPLYLRDDAWKKKA